MDFNSLLAPFKKIYNFAGDTAKKAAIAVVDATNELYNFQLADALHEAILHIDQQTEAINIARIGRGFKGAEEMDNAVSILKKAAKPWPKVKASIIAAANDIVQQESKVKSLGGIDKSVAELQATLTAYATGPLKQLKENFAVAKSGFDTFERNLDAAYSESLNANAKAEVAIKREKATLKKSKERLDNLMKDMTGDPSSTSSPFSLDRLVGGIPGGGLALLPKYKRELEEVIGRQEELAFNEECYKEALASYTNILSATKITSYALLTLDTTIQQSLNSLNDMSALTSANLTVMKAELEQFKTEFESAVRRAAHLY